jgi:hypothetical protein
MKGEREKLNKRRKDREKRGTADQGEERRRKKKKKRIRLRPP